MALHEIDDKTADFDEIMRFAMNLLGEQKQQHPRDYEARIAYFSTATQVVLARRADESSRALAVQIDQARSAVTEGLEKLAGAIKDASDASERTAKQAAKDSGRMVNATWALVFGTGLLGLATLGLVYYTRELAGVELSSQSSGRQVEPAPVSAPPQGAR